MEEEIYGFSKTMKSPMANNTFEEDVPTTQYTLIYPSFNHPESEYRKYIEHA